MKTIDPTNINGDGNFHRRMQYKASNGTFITVTGTITGCGLCQISGIIYLHHLNKEEFLAWLKDTFVIKQGCGSFICTLGQDYYLNSFEYEKYVLDFGFKLLSEYPNLRQCNHGTYKQRLYLLTL